MRHKCIRCGKPVKKQFMECYTCHMEKLEETRRRHEAILNTFIDDEPDGSPMCVMCGKEWGTAERKDGKYYCATCWTVWNS